LFGGINLVVKSGQKNILSHARGYCGRIDLLLLVPALALGSVRRIFSLQIDMVKKMMARHVEAMIAGNGNELLIAI